MPEISIVDEIDVDDLADLLGGANLDGLETLQLNYAIQEAEELKEKVRNAEAQYVAAQHRMEAFTVRATVAAMSQSERREEGSSKRGAEEDSEEREGLERDHSNKRHVSEETVGISASEWSICQSDVDCAKTLVEQEEDSPLAALALDYGSDGEPDEGRGRGDGVAPGAF